MAKLKVGEICERFGRERESRNQPVQAPDTHHQRIQSRGEVNTFPVSLKTPPTSTRTRLDKRSLVQSCSEGHERTCAHARASNVQQPCRREGGGPGNNPDL